ncbi:hypothetical protein PFI31113_01796 [Pandoraea fibrosis]|uniref:Uncharacterized protein n=2 Tax=Pandoraea fibrosis TaxID=1891094 RepID=A0A5E4U4W2_9BURK|nr:hypothetical protein PFI31113_01796 [Pandoraea fibrosis]
MSSVSNQRAVRTTPRYDLPPTAHRTRLTHERLHAFRARSSASHAPFAQSFLGARGTPTSVGLRAMTSRAVNAETPERVPVWSAALAVMLISQLATPTVAARPGQHTADGALDAMPYPGGRPAELLSNPSSSPAPLHDPAIAVRPVEHTVIRSDYTFPEALRAVSAAREPFRHLGESVGDAYEILGGHEMTQQTRERIRAGAEVIDFATGFLPDVQLLRLPGELAGVLADSLEGKAPEGETLAGLVQSADPRGLNPHAAPHARRLASRPARGEAPHAPGIPSDRPLHPVPRAQMAARRKPSPDGEAIEAEHFFLAPDAVRAKNPVPATSLYIEGETEHLRGYEQVLSAEALPPGKRPRLLLINGNHYIGGDAGYYRAARGRSDDHWLIHAPRRDKAQVPVTFDSVTGQWQAHAPLRLCGGGCGGSKEPSTDSIAGTYSEIEAAIRHLHDERAQMAILHGMGELADMHLLRTNRRDTRGSGDNSIVAHRAALRKAMKHIDRYAPLVTQQRQAAEITSRHYYWNHYAEAFCHENAEILFHQLLQRGISEDRLRIITVTPHQRSPHVLVLYTEAHDFITLLDLATPQPPVVDRRDGISGVTFGGFVYMNKGQTILLDPWSTTKAIEFSRAGNELDVIRTLDEAFADIGLQSGQPYTVSVTRPFGSRIFGARQRSISSLGSTGSRGSAGSLGSLFGGEGAILSRPEPLSRPDASPSGRRLGVPKPDAVPPT